MGMCAACYQRLRRSNPSNKDILPELPGTSKEERAILKKLGKAWQLINAGLALAEVEDLDRAELLKAVLALDVFDPLVPVLKTRHDAMQQVLVSTTVNNLSDVNDNDVNMSTVNEHVNDNEDQREVFEEW